MEANLVKRRAFLWLSLLGLGTLMASLVLLSQATQYAEEYGRWYSAVLAINIVGVLVLAFLIAANVLRLVREYRAGQAGSRLNARVLLMFVALAVAPLTLVFYFSVQFLNRGIDSYFNVDVETALVSALDLSRASLEMRTREYLQRTITAANQLDGETEDLLHQLSNRRQLFEAAEFTVFGANRKIMATSSGSTEKLASLPPEDVLLNAYFGRSHVGLDTTLEGEVIIQAAVPIPNADPTAESLFLFGVFPVDTRITELTEQVQQSLDQYGEVSYLRRFLKSSFTLTLWLTLLISLLAAVWGAFVFSRRLIAPIQSLAGGTKAVAAGDFSTRLPPSGHDDLGFLVESFNAMTAQLQNARTEAQKSQLTAERERARLAIILARLSSGVVVVDEQLSLHTVNAAAGAILDFDFKATAAGISLREVAATGSALLQLVNLVATHFDANETEWREQLEINQQGSNKVLIVASTALPTSDSSWQRCVVVFEDITQLIQAQKQAAWGEVARRLAHEIKNPLTPIQLSAERLQQRFANEQSTASELVARSTKTIVQQVEAMKDMVNAFSEYARPREMELVVTDVNVLVEEMTELYRIQAASANIQLQLDAKPSVLAADVGRLRQIIHNLILNAIEACDANVDRAEIEISTSLVKERGRDYLRLSVRDNGPGFKMDLSKVFEPYMTSKPKGTGLGLAIVRKLVEEHGGSVFARNREQGGAELVCHFPSERVQKDIAA